MKQQELNNLLQNVIAECKAIKLPVSKHIEPEVLINRRAKKRFGACKKYRKSFVIELSEMMLNADPVYIKNILAHEVLHTCPGCQNHGKKWKYLAQLMNNTYGYKITTTTSYEKMGLENPNEIGGASEKNIYKYIIKCEKCGQTIYRQKKSKLITHTNNYRCKCGGKLNITMKKEI